MSENKFKKLLAGAMIVGALGFSSLGAGGGIANAKPHGPGIPWIPGPGYVGNWHPGKWLPDVPDIGDWGDVGDWWQTWGSRSELDAVGLGTLAGRSRRKRAVTAPAEVGRP
jgi:hypothetical protein